MQLFRNRLSFLDALDLLKFDYLFELLVEFFINHGNVFSFFWRFWLFEFFDFFVNFFE